MIVLGRFPFNRIFRKFRNGIKWHRKLLGKFPENQEIAEIPKSKPLSRKFRKFREESQMQRKFQERSSESFVIPREVLVFCGKSVKGCSIRCWNLKFPEIQAAIPHRKESVFSLVAKKKTMLDPGALHPESRVQPIGLALSISIVRV